jgi:hypothetical protein
MDLDDTRKLASDGTLVRAQQLYHQMTKEIATNVKRSRFTTVNKQTPVLQNWSTASRMSSEAFKEKLQSYLAFAPSQAVHLAVSNCSLYRRPTDYAPYKYLI